MSHQQFSNVECSRSFHSKILYSASTIKQLPSGKGQVAALIEVSATW